MNCPTCSGALISVKMRKDNEGYPTFSFSCPKHGPVGEKRFKREFRPSRRASQQLIRSWERLAEIAVKLAWLYNTTPNCFNDLNNQLSNDTAAFYLMNLRGSVLDGERMSRTGGRGHLQIGECSQCDGIRLWDMQYRMDDAEFPVLYESHARRLILEAIAREMQAHR